MKPLVLFLSLLLAPIILSAQSFTIAITPPVQTIVVGETATYSIVITPENGYNASVFLSVAVQGFKGSAVISNTTPNPPYANVTLKVKPSASDTDSKTITVIASNGGIKTSAVCTLTSLKNVQWAVIKPAGNYISSQKSLGKNNNGEVCLAYLYNGSNPNSIYLHQFKNKRWEIRNVPLNSSDHHEYHSSPFAFDNNGIFWGATSNGIVKYDGTFTTMYNKSNSEITEDLIQAVQIDRNGFPVFIAYNNYKSSSAMTLIRFDGTAWTSLNTMQPSLQSDSRGSGYSFAIDKQNRVWFASGEGIIRVTDTTQEIIGSPIHFGRTIQMLSDRDGWIWCLNGGKDNANALQYHDGTFWKPIPSPTTKEIKSFSIGSNKNIYVTSSEGLHLYNGTTWTTYSIANIPFTIYDVTRFSNESPLLTCDNNNNLWMLIGDNYYVFNPNGLVDIPLAPTAVEEQPSEPESGITLSPNPSSNSFSVSGLHNVRSLRMVNSFGMEVFAQEVVGDNTTVDVSSLASGMYFVQFRSAAGTVVKSLVVNH